MPVQNPFETSVLLKKSLAETLTCFYPLAGRAMDDFIVECNDEGVEYSETRVFCNMSETIESNDAKEINILFPYEMHFDFKNEVLLAIQFSVFDCGGIAIGLSFSHKIVDGTSAIAFVSSWAAITQGDIDDHEVIQNLNFDSSIHFPAKDVSGYMGNRSVFPEKIVTKRFVFSKWSISALREASGDGQIKQTTRYEAVSAFIWMRLMAIFQSKQGHKNKEFASVHAVNLRGRSLLPLTSNSFGNIWQYAIAPSPKHNESDKENQSSLVRHLSKAIREMDGDYVRKLQKGELYMQDRIKDVEVIAFTSWCTFPMYEIDFGWGKPIFATSLARPFKNVTVLTSTRNGDGIEAWVNLLEEDMAMFERDKEVLCFVS